ncbi:MAG: hypothetical protein P8M53_04535 [Pirellulales bacterium]|nr:hypothetical protein [Pirellulales bacterium]
MKTNWMLLPLMLFAVSLFAVSSIADAADGGQEKSASAAAEKAPEAKECEEEKAACCPAPCITYRQRGRCRKVCCGCDPPVKTTLKVADPCCCKTCYDIPICLPACCKGEPCVTDRCGALCKGVVVYKWCCGYKVKVVIKKCGDIVVTSYRC